MDPPRDKAPSPTKFPDSQRPAAPQETPTRPPIERIQPPPRWTGQGDRVAHEKSAIETIKWRNAQNSAPETGAPSPPKGQAAIRADIQKAQGSLPERAQARDQAAAPDDAALKGKAGLQADRYKAMQSEPQKPTPARDGGRDR